MEEQDNQATNVADELASIDEKVDGLHHYIVEQEHRLVSVLINLYKSRHKETDYRKAALKALLYKIIPGKSTTLLTGGFAIGILTLALMYKNNQLMEEQNYQLQLQIYSQTLNQYQLLEQNVLTYLLTASDISIAEQEKWRNDRTTITELEDGSTRISKTMDSGNVPLLQPKYDVNFRSIALNRLISMRRDIPNPPRSRAIESPWTILKSWACEKFGCDLSVPPVSTTLNTKDKPLLELENAFLNEIEWPDTNDFQIYAPNANFSYSKMNGVDLSDAVLTEAQFIKADIRDVNLSGANLHEAQFYGADINGVDLRGASISEAHFLHAEGVDFISIDCDQIDDFYSRKKADLRAHCEAKERIKRMSPLERIESLRRSERSIEALIE